MPAPGRFLGTAARLEDAALLLPGNSAITYAQLDSWSGDWSSRLSSKHKQLIFFYVSNTPVSVAALLGAIASGNAVALLDPKLSVTTRQQLEDAYRPWIVLESITGYADEISLSESNYGMCAPHTIHAELSVLLSTSGSSGSPKFVKLTKANLQSNAQAIAQVLDISADDIALAHLEMHYSYGLSVVTSHLARGAAIGFSRGKFTDRGFWDEVRALQISHMPGVPYHHEMISRLGLDRLKLPTLKILTQAGGRLTETISGRLHAAMEKRGGRFYVMYGQTEASPRMTTLHHDDFEIRKGSVGKTLPGGKITIVDEQGRTLPAGSNGEVVFQGPNVMLGYAHCGQDLGVPDGLQDTLYTGDKGHLDEDGYLYIVGRLSRIAKIYGWRINLDEIEKYCELLLEDESSTFAAVQMGEEIHILNNCTLDGKDARHLQEKIADRFALPSRVLTLHMVSSLPVNDRGKINYKAVSALVSHAG